MSLVDEALLKRIWTRLESRAQSLIKDWPDPVPGQYLNFNQGNGAIYYSDALFDGYGVVGLLWLLYDHTGHDEYKQYALDGASSFAPVSELFHSHTGVATYRTAAWGYELTGDERLKSVAMKGAETFAGFWDPQNEVIGRRPGVGQVSHPASVQDRYHVTRSAGETRRWRTAVDWGGFWFECLYWAAKYEPRYLEYAVKHSESYIRLGFVREDGSSHHGLRFNPETGEPEEFITPQGYSADTTWSRGHAWLLMQYAQAYEATGMQLFLDTFLRCADYWVEHLPDDLVPYYDMSDPRIPHVPRDSCSAVIAMNAMIRICQKRPELEPRFKKVVGDTMRELYDFYLTPGGLLLHGSWGADHEPLHERVLHFGNLYLPDAVYMAMRPDRFARIRGF